MVRLEAEGGSPGLPVRYMRGIPEMVVRGATVRVKKALTDWVCGIAKGLEAEL